MLEEARTEAQRLVREGRLEADAERQRVLQAAHRQGYDEGLTQGHEEGRAAALEEARKQFAAEQAVLVNTLINLVDTFKASRERLFVEARRDVIVLATAIASRIVDALSNDDAIASDAATSSCREALELIGEVTEVVFRAHPDDVDALARFCDEIVVSGLLGRPADPSWPASPAPQDSARPVRVVADAAVGRGGVIVQTADSIVDATVASRVARIADELVSDWRGRMTQLGLGSHPLPPITRSDEKPAD